MTSHSHDSPWVVPLWRDGQPVQTSSTLDVVSPRTNSVLHRSAAASVEDAAAAVAAAEKALPSWSKTKFSYRRDLLLRAADEVVQQREEMWQISRDEIADSEEFFSFSFDLVVDSIRATAGLLAAASSHGTVPAFFEDGHCAITVKEPYGVVLGIAPWNAPWPLGLRAFLGPLAMGNTVVVKGAEKSPACYWKLAEIFHKVGLPKGCLNTVIHRPEDGPAVVESLIASPAVRKVSFTGSTALGSIIAGLAGKHLKPVLMELGGKSPAIVCDDANLHLAAETCAASAFLHAGQICMSTERIIVDAKVAEEFKSILSQTMEQQFSPEKKQHIVIDTIAINKKQKLLEDAVAKGAKVLHGDRSQSSQPASSGSSAGNTTSPVVLEGVKPDMDIYYTESFVPSVSLFVADSIDDAIRLANDTEYGLSSSVFTTSLQRGLEIARQIETGAVHINSMSVHDEARLPHGGAKKSGFGRFNGEEGLREWVRLKNITWQA